MNIQTGFGTAATTRGPEGGGAGLPAPPPFAARMRDAATTGAVLGLLWAGFHWSDPASWVIGVPVMLLGGATAFLVPGSRGPRLSVVGIARFAGFAIRGIGLGALDVSLRSLRPASLDAGCFHYRTRLPEGRPRRLLGVAITLLPGTLTARFEADRLEIHALDRGEATRREIASLEAVVARMFGLDLSRNAA